MHSFSPSYFAVCWLKRGQDAFFSSFLPVKRRKYHNLEREDHILVLLTSQQALVHLKAQQKAWLWSRGQLCHFDRTPGFSSLHVLPALISLCLLCSRNSSLTDKKKKKIDESTKEKRVHFAKPDL